MAAYPAFPEVANRPPHAAKVAIIGDVRSLFRSSFGTQYSRFDFGILPSMHVLTMPEASLDLNNDLVFWKNDVRRPGRSRPCRRKRKPRRWSAFLTSISGFVSFDRMRDIITERKAAVSPWICHVQASAKLSTISQNRNSRNGFCASKCLHYRYFPPSSHNNP